MVMATQAASAKVKSIAGVYAGSLQQRLEECASSRADLILAGEPGVGKRFFAEALHNAGSRKKQGGLLEISPDTSDDELRAILFNEERKRYEGILGREIPMLDRNSTLLIRNVTEFSLMNQMRIARFLIQNTPAQQNGSSRVRVILTTARQWDRVIEKRLIVDSLVEYSAGFEKWNIPPLRERVEDIPGLVQSILREVAFETGKEPLQCPPETVRELQRHTWLDNVRELRFVVEEGASISENVLTLPAAMFGENEMVSEILETIRGGRRCSIELSLDFLEKSLVQRALIRHNFDLASASRSLSLTEQNLRYRMKKHNIFIPVARRRGLT
jgi:DNA-binding NtrC family response regulator